MCSSWPIGDRCGLAWFSRTRTFVPCESFASTTADGACAPGARACACRRRGRRHARRPLALDRAGRRSRALATKTSRSSSCRCAGRVTSTVTPTRTRAALASVMRDVAPDVLDIHEEPFSVAARQWLAAAPRRSAGGDVHGPERRQALPAAVRAVRDAPRTGASPPCTRAAVRRPRWRGAKDSRG